MCSSPPLRILIFYLLNYFVFLGVHGGLNVFGCYSRASFLHHFEGTLYFLLDLRELGLQDRLLRIKHHIYRNRNFRQVKADSLTHTPLDAIAINRSTQNPANRKTNAGSTRVLFRPE